MSQTRHNELLLAKFKKRFKVNDNLNSFLILLAEAWKQDQEDIKEYGEDYELDFGSLEEERSYHAYKLFEDLNNA